MMELTMARTCQHAVVCMITELVRVWSQELQLLSMSTSLSDQT